MLCGSVPSSAEGRKYFSTLCEVAEGAIDIGFIVSLSIGELRDQLGRASAYVQATGFGIGREAISDFAKAEHFGIANVEAVAAGCETFAYQVGGPREIFEKLDSGRRHSSLDELAVLMEQLEVARVFPEVRDRAASEFGEDHFAKDLLRIVG